MKQMITLIITILIIFAVGCDDNGVTPDSSPLEGRWFWVSSVGGFAYDSLYPQSSDDYRTLIIDKHRIRTLKGGEFILDEKYTIRMMTSPYFPEEVPTLVIDNHMSQAYVITEDRDSLFLYDNCVDCYAHTYVWIK